MGTVTNTKYSVASRRVMNYDVIRGEIIIVCEIYCKFYFYITIIYYAVCGVSKFINLTQYSSSI